MLVKLVANELVDGEIDFVSLVKHGANRSPFKIIKMEDMPEESTMGNLKDKLNVMFGKETPEVSAFFVKAGEEDRYIPLIQKAGFVTDATESAGAFTIFKQAGFIADEDVTLIALDDSMGMAFDRLVKDFTGVSNSADFVENVGASAFFPGMHNAMEALAESIWNALNGSANMGEAQSKIDKNLAAFKRHVNALVKNMPESVIKMEYEALANHIGGSTLTPDAADISKAEDENMTQINEALAGDLAGLNDTEQTDVAKLQKTEAEKAPSVTEIAQDAEIVFLDEDGNEISEEEFEKAGGKGKKMKKAKPKAAPEGEEEEAEMAKGAEEPVEKMGLHSPGSSVILSTSDNGLPKGYKKEERTVKAVEDGEIVERTGIYAVPEEGTDGEEIFMGFVSKEAEEVAALEEQIEETAADNPFKAIAGPLDLIGKALNAQSETMKEIKNGLAKQTETMDALVKTNEEAIEKADSTTLVDYGYDLDESLGLMNNHQPVAKSVETQGSIWKGLCPELDDLEAKFNGEQ